MSGPVLRTLVASLTPGALLLASEVPTIQPTPSVAPPVREQLVDYVVPSYGVSVPRDAAIDVRVEQLAHEIQTYVGRVESEAMVGDLHRPRRSYQIQADDSGLPVAVAQPREPLPAELELAELAGRLAVLDQELPYPNLLEEWQFEQAWASLDRASDLLRLGLSEASYLRLEEAHQAWLTYLQRKLLQVQAEYAQELVDEQGMSPSSAIAQARSEITTIPYPPMSLTGDYPEIVIPEVMRPTDLPQQQPEEPAAPAEAPAPDTTGAEAPSAGAEASTELDPATQLTLADALLARGSELVEDAATATTDAERDELGHRAEVVLSAAIDRYARAIEADPGNTAAGDQLRAATRQRSSARELADTVAGDHPEATSAGEATVAEITAAILSEQDDAPPAAPVAEELPAEPTAGPAIGEPAADEPSEPEPVAEEPAAEDAPVEEQPAAPQPAPEPEPAPAEPEADDGSLDDLEFPDL